MTQKESLNITFTFAQLYNSQNNMMRILTTIGFALLLNSVFAQSNVSDKIYSNAHGLVKGTSLYFEVEGYDIFTYDHENLYFDNTGIKKAKKKYNIDKENLGAVDSTLEIKHRYYVIDYKISDDLNQQNVLYFIQGENNKIKVIAFSRVPERDIEIERLFVKSIHDNSVPEIVYSQPNTDTVYFAGRYLYLGGACRWMGPHNIQCPDYGQISWSEFRSLDKAKQRADINYQLTANNSIGDVLENDSVAVIFEGVETKALKTRYKINKSQLIMGGSNILIIYYVAVKVRGNYVACMMSQYTDDVNAKELAPLLGELMELK
jgi:hypothetical protein